MGVREAEGALGRRRKGEEDVDEELLVDWRGEC